MRNKYLIRLDDACPTMDSQKWSRMEKILDKYGIKPMAGIIPHNEDPDQLIDDPDIAFWDKMKLRKRKVLICVIEYYIFAYICRL